MPKNNAPLFRDGKPWPEAIAGANRDAKGRATGTEGGYTIINARRIWDADPMHNTMSYPPTRTPPTSWSSSTN